ncbi:MAG: V-type ATPase subunit [Clostridia bacterium]|nr:V-type ATPase subunit [Clostridia bacterium]
MRYYDMTYTSGVIAVREKFLLKEKILRFCEVSAEDAFRSLLESGFGGGAEVTTNVYEYENLIAVEERRLDEFIREYAPTEAEKAYLLSPRDFHNAKALLKAAYLGTDASRLLASEGLIEIAKLSTCIEEKDFTPLKELNAYLGGACEDGAALLAENPSGAKLGEIFENAQYQYLWNLVKRKPTLKKLLVAKADMNNILIALRAGDVERAKEKYLPVGKLDKSTLEKLFLEDKGKAVEAFADTPYAEFVKVCLEAAEKRLPMTEAERRVASYDVEFFNDRKYELEKEDPFLYYVYRRKTENANVRIVFACLLAGMSEHEIKKRLRRCKE